MLKYCRKCSLMNPHKRILNERRRYNKFEDIKGLHPSERGIIPQDAVGQEESQRKLKKVHSRIYRFCGEISLYCRL